MINRFAFLIFLTLTLSSCTSSLTTKKTPEWVEKLEDQIPRLEKKFDGQFGVYVYDLETKEAFSYKANDYWYLSSTVKVPVAIALLKMVDQKKANLNDKVTIKKSDYRDGAGPVNWLKPGDKVSYRYLLDQMLIYSDNAATDLIIKKVGLENVNKLVAEYSIANEFGPITTLIDVRRKAYGKMHPKAEKLSNESFLAIKKKRGSKKRTAELVKQLKIKNEDLVEKDLSKAFDQYYAEHWNSATLLSYSKLLENLVNEKILSKKATEVLLKIMSGIQTGKKRVSRGLPRSQFYAHKTGTQHRQACDMGIAGDRKNKKPKTVILVCTKKWKKLSKAEKLMAQVAKLISQSKLHQKPKSK